MEACKCSKEKEVATLQAETRTLFKRVDENRASVNNMNKLYEMIYNLTTNISLIAEQMKTTKEDVEVIKKDVEKIKNLPSEDLRHYKRTIIVGIISFVVSFVLAKVF